MLRRSELHGLLAAAVLVIPACSSEDPKDYRFPVYPADGKVVYKGRPVGKAIVRFHPVDPATVKFPEGKEGPAVMLTTETDEHGLFAMSTYLGDDGVPAGEYKVTVATGAAAKDIENADEAKKPAVPPLPKYRDPATTTLKADVKPGQNHFVLELQ